MSATSLVNAAAGAHLYFAANYTLLDGVAASRPRFLVQMPDPHDWMALCSPAVPLVRCDWNGPRAANGATAADHHHWRDHTLFLDGGTIHT